MKLLNLFLCLAAFTFSHTATGQDVNTTTQTFEGNTATIAVQIDTFEVVDPVTGDVFIKLEKSEHIAKLNSREIYYGTEASEPVGAASQSDYKTFLKSLLHDELESMTNVHSIDIIIDETGNLGFFRLEFLRLDKDSEKEIEPIRKKIIDILKGVHFIPAKHNGKSVPYGIGMMIVK